jgi:peptide/nickel transport system substrate-binding protein
MRRSPLADLARAYRHAALNRRDVVMHGSALGVSLAASISQAGTTGGQTPGTPLPAYGQAQTSITRATYLALLRDTFPFEEVSVPGGHIILGASADASTLNPILASDFASGTITGLVFNSLVGTSAIDGSNVPDLADYWVQEADGVSYTFYLNENARWHDGEPVTAHDCAFSFDVTLDDASLSPHRSTVTQMLESYRAIDDHAFRLVAKQPFATFVGDTAGEVGIIPKHLWESVPAAAFGSDPGSTGQDPSRVVGSGPFVFREWVLGDHVTLDKNPDFWDPARAPTIDSFTFKVIQDPATLAQSLQTGEIDICDVSFGQLAQVESNPDVRLDVYDTTAFIYFSMMQGPTGKNLFVDRRVRQALMYGLDRDVIAETIFQGNAIRADGTQPVLSVAHDPTRINTIYLYDPEKARQLLDAAGWILAEDESVRERNSVRMSFECLYPEGAAILAQQLPYMQQMWREIGIEMAPVAMPFSSLLDALDAGAFDMGVLGFAWKVDGGQGDMFRCSAVPPSGFNSMRYCNEEYDRLEALQLAELDVDKRVDLLLQQSNLVNDDVAAGIVVFRKSATGSLQTVRNFFPNGYSATWSLPFIWKDA